MTRKDRIRARASWRAQRRLHQLLLTSAPTAEPAATLYEQAERLVDRLDGRPGLFAFRPMTEPELDALHEATHYHELPELADAPLALADWTPGELTIAWGK